MVFRLFVPPGEGQDDLIPRRPDAIGANATLQYTVLASTGLAAAYTSLAASYQRRVRPQIPVSRTALLIRSSARLGIWAGALGAATNWYYYSAFATVAASKITPDLKPWKLYERTKALTVEDGCLAGAALGAVASIPALCMRRPAIPQWTRCVGMTHIGACAGVLGAHGYLQYTGERQKAYQTLERRRKRKHLQLSLIFWNKELMAHFDPIVQLYIRNNGIWHASLLPASTFTRSNQRSLPAVPHRSPAPGPETTPIEESSSEDIPFYAPPQDYAEILRRMDVPIAMLEVEKLELERAKLLAEAEMLMAINAAHQYNYCHKDLMTDDQRRARLMVMFVLEITYTRLQRLAFGIDEKLLKYDMFLQHRALWSGSADSKDDCADWLPKPVYCTNSNGVKPYAAIKQMEDLEREIKAEIKRFKAWSTDAQFAPAMRDRWVKDVSDGRDILHAVQDSLSTLNHHLHQVEHAQAQKQSQSSQSAAAKQEGAAKLLARETEVAPNATNGEKNHAPPKQKNAQTSLDGGVDSKGS